MVVGLMSQNELVLGVLEDAFSQRTNMSCQPFYLHDHHWSHGMSVTK